MGLGDRLLDDSGNVMLDDAGLVILSDAAGDDCCCGVSCDSQPITFPIASITRSSFTGTITFASPHNFAIGLAQTLVISGASPSGYNGTAIVTPTSTTTATYAVSSGLATPATGTITSALMSTASANCGAGCTPPVIQVVIRELQNCGCVEVNTAEGPVWVQYIGNPNGTFCLRRQSANAWRSNADFPLEGRTYSAAGCTGSYTVDTGFILLNKVATTQWILAVAAGGGVQMADIRFTTPTGYCYTSYTEGQNLADCSTFLSIGYDGEADITPYCEVGI